MPRAHSPRAAAGSRWGALLATGLLLACGGKTPSEQPAEARAQPTPPPVLHTEAQDRRVGEHESQKVGGEMGFVEDPDLTGYVNRLGKRLAHFAPQRDFDYQFKIVDEDAPNAFALPGGFIYVSRGLLILTNSEAELANVLSHEIVHVAARHAAARQSVIEGMPLQFGYFAMGYVARYSRDQEREADRMGQSLAGQAGFDPNGMATFLKNLEYTERLRLGGSRLPGFLDTHPATSERVASAGGRAPIITWQEGTTGIARNRSDYLRRLDGLVIGSGAREGVFHGDRFVHPELDFTMRFPAGWETKNTHHAVGAISLTRDAQVFLEFDSRGEDPAQAAQRYLSENARRGVSFDAHTMQHVKIGSFPAARVEGRAGTPQGALYVHMTWIARGGSIYRITGMTIGRSAQLQGTFHNVARSFRPLTPSLRRGVRETRLRIVRAREGESLQHLGERVGNEWDLQRTAVMNDHFVDEPLREAELVKVAISEHYGATEPEG